MNDVWQKPEVKQLVAEIEDLRAIIDKRVKDNRLELYNIGEKIHKKQIEFHTDPHRIKALFGGNRCIAGESMIYDPVKGEYREVQKINEDFHVYAWDENKKALVIAKALKPFHHEDIDDLYEFTLSNGQKFTASMNHRVFDEHGLYKQLYQCPVGYGLFHPQTIEEHDQLIHVSSVENLIQKSRDFRCDCRHSHRLCDEQPHLGANNVQDVAPLQECVQEHIYSGAYEREGDRDNKPLCNHVYHSFYRPSNLGGLLRYVGRNVEFLCRAFYKFWRYFGLHSLFAHQPTCEYVFQPQPIDGFAEFVHRIGLNGSTKTYDTSSSITNDLFVISISHKRRDFKWDFTVPEYGNYYMSGIIHHNTGKTVGGAVEAVYHALGDSRFRKIKPSSGWVVSLTGDVQKEVAQKEILRWLPKKEIQNIIVRHGRKDDLEGSLIEKIVLKNGCFIGFKTCEQGRESFQGASLGWVWFDEEPDEDVFKECLMRLIDTRGDMWFTMTPLKGLTWVYNLIYLNENNNSNIALPWMLEWADNPWLSREEIEQLELTMTEEEREARQFGRFTSLCGFAFNELRKEIHIKAAEVVPDWYKRYVSIDYGLDSLAALWYWVDKFGNARIYRTLRKKNLIISEAAKELLKFTGNERIEAFYAPPDLWNRRQDTGKSAAMIFYENGISLLKTSNDRESGWLNVHEWLRPYETRDEQTGETYKTAKLTFDEGLDPDLWKHLTTIQKSAKNPNDVATQPHEVTHYPDSLRCFCVSRMIATTEPVVNKHYNFDFERPDNGSFGEYTEDFFDYRG